MSNSTNPIVRLFEVLESQPELLNAALNSARTMLWWDKDNWKFFHCDTDRPAVTWPEAIDVMETPEIEAVFKEQVEKAKAHKRPDADTATTALHIGHAVGSPVAIVYVQSEDMLVCAAMPLNVLTEAGKIEPPVRGHLTKLTNVFALCTGPGPTFDEIPVSTIPAFVRPAKGETLRRLFALRTTLKSEHNEVIAQTLESIAAIAIAKANGFDTGDTIQDAIEPLSGKLCEVLVHLTSANAGYAGSQIIEMSEPVPGRPH